MEGGRWTDLFNTGLTVSPFEYHKVPIFLQNISAHFLSEAQGFALSPLNDTDRVSLQILRGELENYIEFFDNKQ